MFFLFAKRGTIILKIGPINMGVESLLTPFIVYGEMTLGIIFAKIRLITYSSLINSFILKTLKSHYQRGR
jgi:hypothetical protein